MTTTILIEQSSHSELVAHGNGGSLHESIQFVQTRSERELPWQQEIQQNNKPQLNRQNLIFRPLTPSDYNRIKYLCELWFPVQYPEQWFETVVNNSQDPCHGSCCCGLYSIAAVYEGVVVGLIIAELKPTAQLPTDDRDIVANYKEDSNIGYILSLGVVEEFRRFGIASQLLDQLTTLLRRQEPVTIGIYLHVLTNNSPALKFYSKHNFTVHKFLPYYYNIQDSLLDGFTCVKYFVNPTSFNTITNAFLWLLNKLSALF